MFLQKGKTGLWIVDVQEKLFPLIDRSHEVFEKICFVLESAKILKLPIFVTEQYPEGLGPLFKPLALRLDPKQKIYAKTTFSGMHDPKIKEAIQKYSVDNWILIGIEAHICILQTAKDLQNFGKKAVVLNDAISSRSLYDYATAIGELRDEKIRVSSSETVIYELMRDSKCPEFKELLSLIKEHV